MLLIHILIALAGMIQILLTAITPSKIKLHISYVFVALTTVSGIMLVLFTEAALSKVCLSGMVYFAMVGISLSQVKSKLLLNDKDYGK